MGSGLFVLSVRIAVIIPMHQSVLSCIGRGDDGRRRRGVEEHLREQSIAEAKRALVDRWEKSSLPARLKALEHGLHLQYRRMQLLSAQLGTAQA
jgi:hypothetical protein